MNMDKSRKKAAPKTISFWGKETGRHIFPGWLWDPLSQWRLPERLIECWPGEHVCGGRGNRSGVRGWRAGLNGQEPCHGRGPRRSEVGWR